jgi:hypothetical protein
MVSPLIKGCLIIGGIGMEAKTSYQYLEGMYLARQTKYNGKEIIFVEKGSEHVIEGRILQVEQIAFYTGIWDMGLSLNHKIREATDKEIQIFNRAKKGDN